MHRDAALGVGKQFIIELEGEVEGLPEGDRYRQVRSALVKNLPGTFPVLVAIGTDEVEVIPLDRDLGPELFWGSEAFPVEEFICNEARNGFDIALPGEGAHGDIMVFGAAGADEGWVALAGLVIGEFCAPVGLPAQEV